MTDYTKKAERDKLRMRLEELSMHDWPAVQPDLLDACDTLEKALRDVECGGDFHGYLGRDVCPGCGTDATVPEKIRHAPQCLLGRALEGKP